MPHCRRSKGAELPQTMPCFRDPDNLIYGKAEAGGVVLGGYELNPNARWIDGVPWEHAGTSVTPDERRFEPLLQGAARRFPFISEAGVIKLVCHPDAMTPDANPLLGPVPGVHGLFMAAGLSLNGFGGAGGIGKSLTELITAGEERAGPVCLSPLALRPRPSRPSLCGRAGQRGLSLLLLSSLPVRRRRMGPATPDERPASPDARPGRGLRGQARLGAARAL